MKWKSIKDDPPTDERWWYMVRSEDGGMPHLALLVEGRLRLNDDVEVFGDDAMDYDEWLELPP